MVNVPLYLASTRWRHLTFHWVAEKNNSEKSAPFVDLSQLFHYDRIRIQISTGKEKHIFPSHFSPCALAPYFVITFYNNCIVSLFEMHRSEKNCFPLQVGLICIFIHAIPETLLHGDTLNHCSVWEHCSRPPSGGGFFSSRVMEGTAGLQHQDP